MMITLLIADTAANSDPQVSGPWVTAFVIALIGALGSFAAHIKGKRMGHKEALTKVEVQGDVHTKEKVELVTTPVLEAALDRIEESISKLEELRERDRETSRESLGKVHKRMDDLSERLGDRLSSLEGKTAGIDMNVSKLLDLALDRAAQLKTPRRSGS